MAALVLALPTARAEEVAERPAPLDRVFAECESADSLHSRVGELTLDVDGLLFFRNNEFATPMAAGYTLPGVRLRPTLAYRPSASVSLEAGIFALRYWGTDEYPVMAYRDIATWTGRSNRGLHLLPIVRARMTTRFGLEVVLGTLYGGASHRLPYPLYAPELNLTADPEAGVQLLYRHDRVRADLWVNWESFIYRGDTHQEAFVFGLSTAARLTRPSAKIDLRVPVSVLVQHRGGEIDVLTTESMQTLMNASAGVAASLPFTLGHRSALAGAEADYMLYRQVAGKIWPYDSGSALSLRAFAEVAGARLKVGWYRCHNFISLLGYPLYGSVATTSPTEVYGSVSTLDAGVEYSYEFAPGYRLGADLELYYQPSSTGLTIPAGEVNPHSSSLSYCFGVYMRVCPSVVLARRGKNK